MRKNLPDFSFIILTYNEEIHIRRILDSIADLGAKVYIVDSFSTDRTCEIAKAYGCEVFQNKFINHPLQWDFALKHIPISSPWVIALDADQYLSPSLKALLLHFSDSEIERSINSIYFNRHNYFQGNRLKYGGYRNFYLLKMFRSGHAASDTAEKLDHRFIVPGKSVVWKKGILIEDNLKEYDLDFWMQKHIRYSEQMAEQEWEIRSGRNFSKEQARLFGSINQQKQWLKQRWYKLPLFVRPHLYFFYRFFLRLGFLENKSGRTFHYLQAYWFRYVVDYKIYKRKGSKQINERGSA